MEHGALTDEEIETLLDTDEPSKEELSRLKAALRWAETRREEVLTFRLRLKLFHVLDDDDAQVLPAFSWLLARFQEAPQRFAEWRSNMLWDYASMVEGCHVHPEITLEQIYQLLKRCEDFIRRFSDGKRTIYELRWFVGLNVGDLKGMRKNFAKWEQQPSDDLSCCRDCEDGFRFSYWNRIDDHKALCKATRRLLRRKSFCENCSLEKQLYAVPLRALVLEGKFEEADVCHRKGYRLLCRKTDLWHLGDHLAYLGHIENFAKGVALLERNMPVILGCNDLNDKGRFYFAVAAFLRRLAERKPQQRMRLPRNFPRYNKDGAYEVAQLAAWFAAEAAAIAKLFDYRNGNDEYTVMCRQGVEY